MTHDGGDRKHENQNRQEMICYSVIESEFICIQKTSLFIYICLYDSFRTQNQQMTKTQPNMARSSTFREASPISIMRPIQKYHMPSERHICAPHPYLNLLPSQRAFNPKSARSAVASSSDNSQPDNGTYRIHRDAVCAPVLE